MVSLKKVFQVFVDADKIAQNRAKQSLEWFFTNEGEAEYRAANTVAKKTAFIYDFLVKDDIERTRRYGREISTDEHVKLAFFLASCIDGSSLPYGKYPKILQRKENPFLQSSYLNLPEVLGELLKTKTDGTEYNFYEKLSFDTNAEAYAIQRLALSIFGGYSLNSFPYGYDVFDDAGETKELIEEGMWG